MADGSNNVLYLTSGKKIIFSTLYQLDQNKNYSNYNTVFSVFTNRSQDAWDKIYAEEEHKVVYEIVGGSVIEIVAVTKEQASSISDYFGINIIYSNGRRINWNTFRTGIKFSVQNGTPKTDNDPFCNAIGLRAFEKVDDGGDSFSFISFVDRNTQWSTDFEPVSNKTYEVNFKAIDPTATYYTGQIREYPYYFGWSFVTQTTENYSYTELSTNGEGEKKPAPYPEGNTTGGGFGTQDFSTDETGRPPLPIINNANTGFTKLFMPNQTELNNLHRYLWKTDVATALRRVFDNANDCIISLLLMPCSVPTFQHVLNYSFLDLVTTGVAMSQASSSYYETSFTIKLEECFASCMDYEASSYQLYLPYYGIAKIEAEDLYNTETHEGYNIEVIYQTDLTTGDTLISYYNEDKNYIVYQWTCSLASEIIINSGRGSGAMWFDFWSNVGMSAATMGVMGGASGGAVTIGAEQGNMASQLVSSVMANKGNIAHSGSISGSMKHGGLRVPYLYITYPHLAMAKDYGKLNGYACNYYSKIGDNSGYTVCQLVHLDSITCFNKEREELESLLTSGVIINKKDIEDPTDSLVLFHNNSENIEVYKDLEELGSFENIEVMDETNLSSPSFIINSITAEAVKGTYLYYAPFKRYYYVDSITMVNNDLWRLETTCDLLMSFRDELMEQTAILNRQANNYNLYLSDTYFKAEADAIVCGRKFDGSFDNLNYFLLVASDDFNN